MRGLQITAFCMALSVLQQNVNALIFFVLTLTILLYISYSSHIVTAAYEQN